jgi:ribosomal protein L11 methyltransferase
MIYCLQFSLSENVELNAGATNTREDAIARFNDACSADDFLGVTEGILLAEEAHERGYETESWVLDAGMAPHERDWLSHEKQLNLSAYFKTEKAAQAACSWLKREYKLLLVPVVVAEEEQDWNAAWKAAFTGIEVDATLRVLPPWHEDVQKNLVDANRAGIMVINPGAGFGTGTHETTQLCLRILRGLGSLEGKTILDFGSGSGILGIAAAMAGATQVYCVEIDPMANDNARENAELNQVSDRIQFLEKIPTEIRGGKVDVLIANILRPILLQFEGEIKDCLKPKAELVLSGLIETDLDQVITAYQKGGDPFKIERLEKNEWRALWLRR